MDSLGARRASRLKREGEAAGFNRRMRKTACPVVWKVCGAQSPQAHPIDEQPSVRRLCLRGDLTADLAIGHAGGQGFAGRNVGG